MKQLPFNGRMSRMSVTHSSTSAVSSSFLQLANLALSERAWVMTVSMAISWLMKSCTSTAITVTNGGNVVLLKAFE